MMEEIDSRKFHRNIKAHVQLVKYVLIRSTVRFNSYKISSLFGNGEWRNSENSPSEERNNDYTVLVRKLNSQAVYMVNLIRVS